MTKKNILILTFFTLTIFSSRYMYGQSILDQSIKFGKATFDNKGRLKLSGNTLVNRYKIKISNKWIKNFNEMRTILNIYMNTPNLTPSLTYKIDKAKKELIISIYSPTPQNTDKQPSIKAWNAYFERELRGYIQYKNRK